MKKKSHKLYHFIKDLKAELLWKFPVTAEKGSKLRYKIATWLDKKVINYRLKGLSYMTCDTCGKQGIDYCSEEKHGWKYHGYHFWSCDECVAKKEI